MKTIFLRLVWVTLGSSIAITAALWVTGNSTSPLLLASLGGSTLFLFGLTTLPPAQPRALFGGHLIGALVGIGAYQFAGDALWVMALSVVLTILLMLLTKTVHPPAGANPLILIQAQAGLIHLGAVVMLGVLTIFIVAYVWSRLGVGHYKYPLRWNQPSPPNGHWGIWPDASGKS
jgi:CBS-domain-containing membrane protein